MERCFICKGSFGLARYHRRMNSGGRMVEVDVCSKRCLNKKLKMCIIDVRGKKQ